MSETVYVDGRMITNMDIRFVDDGSTENYYELMVETVGEIISQNGEIQDLRSPVLIASREGLNDVTRGDGAFALQIKDILFNGREKLLPFQALDAQFYSAKAVVFKLATISKDLYEYRTTLDAQHLSVDNPFAQPVSVYNNIQNGFGIFAGASSASDSITMPRPIITSISPKKVKAGDVIVITGENLDDGASVRFSTETGWLSFPDVMRWNDTGIEAVVPSDAITGKIYVSATGWIVPSDEDIMVLK